MDRHIITLIERLAADRSLPPAGYAALLEGRDAEAAAELARRAAAERRRVYGNEIYTRGLIEFTNVCRNDCLYCGIRRSNARLERYRLSPEDIIACADEGYGLGFRTFVLQGGEDPHYTDAALCPIVSEIKHRHPDCAVTLSLGERSRESYRLLREAGADRYLLRHETATESHYRLLHPAQMSWQNRMRCLRDLRELGYAVGAGFMVGSPFQTTEHLVAELMFIEEFKPDMCGIGPFIPHADTPFAGRPAGSVELTCYLLSIIRLMQPDILLPATTALGTLAPDGRERGILSGANVVMPNLSPVGVRKKYALYDGKICTGEESAQCRFCLHRRMAAIGCTLPESRGDRARLQQTDAPPTPPRG